MDINKQNLDRYITGNYGEDQFKEMKEADLELLAKEMYEAWGNEHKKQYPEFYEPTEYVKWLPPTWEDMKDKIKQCWIAAAKYAMDEYIS
jgi:hypothetical protein